MDAASLLPLLLQLFLAAECARAATYLGDAHVAEGDSFFVACVTEPHVSPDWHKDGLPLPSWGHFLFHEDLTDNGGKMNTLYVAHAQPGHSGDYSCGISLRDAHRLRVLPSSSPGSILSRRDSQQDCHHLSPNRSLVISCELSGTGRSVTWYKDDVALHQGLRERYVVEPGRLVVKDARVSDAGIYTCLGSGGAGLSVSVAAPIAIEPMPAFQKARNGEPLKVDDRVTIEKFEEVDDALLRFKPLTTEDAGKYVCKVDNGREHVEFEHTVEVKGKYAALLPFIGICVEVAVLCAIIYVVEKKALGDAMRAPAAAASASELPAAEHEAAEGAAGHAGEEHEAPPAPEGHEAEHAAADAPPHEPADAPPHAPAGVPPHAQ
ncbi:hypothetical protein HPB52_005537 [Rhipicephalus sanguineus]|uniref:Ig-like domain-containing protein n=1 Tax=Rhipicephalus sanguineus TaxID=34632 RepID=A0A9D4Q7C5_RHISA|nr:hypothetical protein HPB52_005537 [Rhipicephalus sanguineus]